MNISFDISEDYHHLILHLISWVLVSQNINDIHELLKKVLISRVLVSQNINDIHQALKIMFDITFDIKSIGLPDYQWYVPSTLWVMTFQNIEMQDIQHILSLFDLIIHIIIRSSLYSNFYKYKWHHLEVVTSSWCT